MRARPTKRALTLAFGSLALFAVGTNVQAGWVFAITALLFGFLFLGLLLPFRALNGVEITRLAPASTIAGEPVEVVLRVRNAARGLRGLVRVDDDFLSPGAGVVSHLWPGESVELASERKPSRRGIFTGGTCTLRTGAPFGAMIVTRSERPSSTTIVYPRTFDARPKRLMGSAGTSGAHSDDVATVREYRPGDPLRHVHWRSSARRGELVVREFEAPARPPVIVAAHVDTDGEVADAVAAVACSLALGALRDGYEVQMLPGPREAATTTSVLEWGARLAPAPPPRVEDGDAFLVHVTGSPAPRLPHDPADERVEVVHVVDDPLATTVPGARSVSVEQVATILAGDASW